MATFVELAEQEADIGKLWVSKVSKQVRPVLTVCSSHIAINDVPSGG